MGAPLARRGPLRRLHGQRRGSPLPLRVALPRLRGSGVQRRPALRRVHHAAVGRRPAPPRRARRAAATRNRRHRVPGPGPQGAGAAGQAADALRRLGRAVGRGLQGFHGAHRDLRPLPRPQVRSHPHQGLLLPARHVRQHPQLYGHGQDRLQAPVHAAGPRPRVPGVPGPQGVDRQQEVRDRRRCRSGTSSLRLQVESAPGRLHAGCRTRRWKRGGRGAGGRP